ncbi:MAG: hypothetical protein ACTFAK_01870 [Candidatus Electronema sp. VV]
MTFLLFYGFFLNVQLYSIRLRRLSAKKKLGGIGKAGESAAFPLDAASRTG